MSLAAAQQSRYRRFAADDCNRGAPARAGSTARALKQAACVLLGHRYWVAAYPLVHQVHCVPPHPPRSPLCGRTPAAQRALPRDGDCESAAAGATSISAGGRSGGRYAAAAGAQLGA